jgi:hypothetical protein
MARPNCVRSSEAKFETIRGRPAIASQRRYHPPSRANRR